jgi:single-strand DNA-binding protein
MNLNKAIIAGNVTQDPEVRTTPSGDKVANFSVATNRFWTDKTTGQKQQKAEFHNIVVWRRLAEIAEEFLKKGSLVMVEGRIETRSWEDETGKRNYKTEIIADNIQLGPRPSGGRTTPEEKTASKEEGDLPTIDADSAGTESDDEIDIKDIPF